MHPLPTFIPLTKTTAAQNEDALSYHRVRGLYFQSVVFLAIIFTLHVRLKEFSETASSRLSIEEFESVDLGEEEDPPAFKASKEKHKLKEVC